MKSDSSFSLRRVAGLLCYIFSAFALFIFVMCVVNRVFWHGSYSIVEDMIVFTIIGLLAIVSALGGMFLRPGRFGMKTLLVGLTGFCVVLALISQMLAVGD
jgi:hypothetical protein